MAFALKEQVFPDVVLVIIEADPYQNVLPLDPLNVASKLLLLADFPNEIIGYQGNQANHSSAAL